MKRVARRRRVRPLKCFHRSFPHTLYVPKERSRTRVIHRATLNRPCVFQRYLSLTFSPFRVCLSCRFAVHRIARLCPRVIDSDLFIRRSRPAGGRVIVVRSTVVGLFRNFSFPVCALRNSVCARAFVHCAARWIYLLWFRQLLNRWIY